MTELRTERLTLRPLVESDLPALLRHWTDPLVRRFLFDDRVLVADQVSELVTGSQRDFAAAGFGLWALRLSDGLVGTVGLKALAGGPAGAIEIVYSLDPEHWGSGLVTEAAVAVLTHAFEVVRLERVWAEIDEGNSASAAVVGRLGMRPVEMVPGELGPMTRYAVTRDAWLESRRDSEG